MNDIRVLRGFKVNAHITTFARLREAKLGFYVFGWRHASSVVYWLNNFVIPQVNLLFDLQDDLDSARVGGRAQDH